MSNKTSRDVLDWFRQWSVGKLEAIGRTDITSNMNIPLSSDPRVQAAITYLEGIKADALTLARTLSDESWGDYQDTLWAEIVATMPAAVLAGYQEMWFDPDPNVRTLLKLLTVCTILLAYIDMIQNG